MYNIDYTVCIPPCQSTESLKTDNTKLYEKVRYLQNFSNTSTGKSSTYARGRNDRDLDLEALEQRYEANVSVQFVSLFPSDSVAARLTNLFSMQ